MNTWRQGESLARHTTWRVGGPAERFFQPGGVEELCEALAGLPQNEPLFWLGLGSNLLVRDGGLAGTVIATAGLNRLEQLEPGLWRVEAGVPSPKVARLSVRQGCRGAEFLAGIPGSFGGALAMNAGAFGGETWPLVREVETVDRDGRRRLRGPTDFQVGYREVNGPPGEYFLAAILELPPGETRQTQARVQSLLAQRRQSQPTHQPSCGSVFRNPPPREQNGELRPVYAARLIEQAGLKGMSLGGARVSEKHANFIINTGHARAGDIERLIHRVQDRVEAMHGLRLKPEVKIVGEP